MANVANSDSSGNPATAPDNQPPTTVMRVALAFVVATFSLVTAGAFGLFLCVVVCFGMFVGLAIAMGHTGGIANDATFAMAHGIGLSTIALFIIATWIYRRRVQRPQGIVGIVVGSPIGTICIALPLLTIFVVRRAWDTSEFGVATGAILLDAFYFYASATVLGVSLALLRTTATAYRWAAASRYRAGLVTGVLVAMLVLFGAIGPHASAASSNDVSRVLWKQTTEAAARLGPLEYERSLLRSLHGSLEGKAGDHHPAPPSPPLAASAQPLVDHDPVSICLETLFRSDVPQVEKAIRANYRLSDDDAKDLVREALINVCVAHAKKPYEKVGAVLQIAADRRAKSNWRQERYARCAVEKQPLMCTPNLPEFDRAEQIDRILDALRCDVKDAITQKVIYMHVVEGKDFVTIDAELGRSPDDSRNRWNNYLKRAARELETKGCAG